ncbi:MAG: alpha/beta hydrolase [Sulfuricurvum sp.]|nr:alpha/beta hydrolase [Sulfuricurvum sp.]
MTPGQELLLKKISFGSTHQLIKYVRHILDSSLTISVHPDLDLTRPTLFCANHFTRVETFLIPSFLYQKLNIKVRSLADSGLFQPKLKEYLESLGTISTKDINRDTIILSDLLQGNNSWLIYPEGSMLKNKKVTISGKQFMIHNAHGSHPMPTGSAVLALKCELEKQACRHAQKEGDIVTVNAFKKKYGVKENEGFSYVATQIVPVSINYFPIRTGKNIFTQMAGSILEIKSEMFLEELEVEGNLLVNAHMHIHLDAPISIEKQIHTAREALNITGHTKSDHDALIEYSRHKLTTLVMDKVYKNTLVNFDHIFALALENYPTDTLRLSHLRAVIFLSVKEILCLKVHKTHGMLHRDFYKLLIDEPYEMFDTVLALACEQKILIPLDDGSYRIDKEALADEHTFGMVRLKNTLRVVLNEVDLFGDLKSLLTHTVKRSLQEVGKGVFDAIFEQDMRRFDYAYQHYYSVIHSKPKDIGRPFILYNPHFDVGMVITHGYKSAPKEMEGLANFVHSLGVNVYCIRMEGHGTVPEDLKGSSYMHWIDSFNRGFAAMRMISHRLYLCGFSAGGVLALIAAASKQHKVDGLICINTAIKFDDLRFNYLLPTMGVISSWLSVINSKIEYIQDTPENPEVNYSEHHIQSVRELKKLIDYAYPLLKKVTARTLIIQGDNDPVVNPKGADMIYNTIQSEEKIKVLLKANEHVILNEKHYEEIFEAVKEFIK